MSRHFNQFNPRQTAIVLHIGVTAVKGSNSHYSLSDPSRRTQPRIGVGAMVASRLLLTGHGDGIQIELHVLGIAPIFLTLQR